MLRGFRSVTTSTPATTVGEASRQTSPPPDGSLSAPTSPRLSSSASPRLSSSMSMSRASSSSSFRLSRHSLVGSFRSSKGLVVNTDVDDDPASHGTPGGSPHPPGSPIERPLSGSSSVTAESLFPNSRHQGWLTKQGQKVRSWKRRFFILTSTLLLYFKSSRDTTVTGLVPLDNYVAGGEVRAMAPGTINKQHCFVLSHPVFRTYYLSAPSERERDEWIKMLGAALAARRAELDGEDDPLSPEVSPRGRAARLVDESGNRLSGDMDSVQRIKASELQIVRKIGTGATGKVYLADLDGRQVAVKKLWSKAIKRSEIRAFRDEVKMMHKLRHPNIVELVGACDVAPHLFLVLEYMASGSLHSIFAKKEQKLLWAQKLLIARDAVTAMVYIHSQDVLHRDLKSANILIDADMTGKIGDFGVARSFSKQNQLNTVVGSPCWMSPETIRHEPYGRPADVYGFGIVLWELVAEAQPYSGLNAMQVSYQVVMNDLRPPLPTLDRGSDAGCPPSKQYLDLMQRCWHKDADKRPTFEDVLKTIQRWLKK